MLIHRNLTLLANILGPSLDTIPRASVMDGAYSRVVTGEHARPLMKRLETHPTDFGATGIPTVKGELTSASFSVSDATPSVLKLTCCPATVFLYEALREGCRNFKGLPLVYSSYGVCAHNPPEPMVFLGYELKELQPARTEIDKSMQEVLLQLAEKAKELCEKKSGGVFQEDSEVSYLMAVELAEKNPFGLGDAFALIAESVKATRGHLDLFQPGNILFDGDDNIVLADPVYTDDADLWGMMTDSGNSWKTPLGELLHSKLNRELSGTLM